MRILLLITVLFQRESQLQNVIKGDGVCLYLNREYVLYGVYDDLYSTLLITTPVIYTRYIQYEQVRDTKAIVETYLGVTET